MITLAQKVEPFLNLKYHKWLDSKTTKSFYTIDELQLFSGLNKDTLIQNPFGLVLYFHRNILALLMHN
jgi:hypothetical protein